MGKFCCCLGLFIIVIMDQAFAAALILLPSDSPSIELLPHAEYYEDSGRQLTIEDLLTGEKTFTLQSGYFINIGFSKSHHWLRFTAINQTQDIHRYLQVSGSISREVNVFTEENGTYKKQKKMKWSKTNRYQLAFEPAKETTVYVQIYDPQGSAIISLRLFNALGAIDHIAYWHAFFAFLMSGLLVLAAYNFLYFIHLRDSAFLTLSVFIVGVALTMGNNEGLLSFFPWIPENLGWLGPSFVFIVLISGLRLGIRLLDVRQQQPELLVWYDLGSILGLILMSIALTYGNGLTLAGFLGIYGLSLIIITLVRLFKSDHRLPKSLAVAMMIFLMSSIPLMLTVVGAIEYYPLVTNLFYIATLISLLIMSLTQAEKIRLQSEYLERTAASNQAKDEFLTTMSHELRTPMNAVVGAGRLLKLTELSKEQTEYVSRLNDSSVHMLSLVNDLLDLARVDHQLLELEAVPFKLEELLSTLKQLVAESASNKQLALTIDNHFLPLKKQLIGDPTRLNQVLINLLGNAIKFTPSGKVSLAITPVEISEDEACLRFEVNDTGVGLTKTQQERLFQVFSQAESSTNRQYGGSGLGLAISQKLITRMGGEITVRSIYKQGSCFSFTLKFPLAASTPKQEKELLTLPQNLIGFKVLLVDDDEMNRFFGDKLLQACGVEAAVAESGEEAIELIQRHSFDLMFMDISMPNVDGYETTRRVRLLPGFNDLVIIALTAHAVAGERERCLAAGMNDYLSKPFELDDLQNMIVKWLATSETNTQLG